MNTQLQAKNEEDFDAMTASIRSALERIRKDRSIPATQESLARLAKCSRKTLHNRKWPIVQLRTIKQERNGLLTKKPSKRPQTSDNSSATREKLLLERVETLQSENAHLFDHQQELDSQLIAAKEVIRVMESERELLLAEIQRIKSSSRQSPERPKHHLHPVGVTTSVRSNTRQSE